MRVWVWVIVALACGSPNCLALTVHGLPSLDSLRKEVAAVDPKALGLSGLLGAVGGAIGGVAVSAGSGDGESKVAQNMAAGAVSGVVQAYMNGRAKEPASAGQKALTTVVSGVSGGVVAAGGSMSSGGHPADGMKQGIAAGLVGAFLSNFASEYGSSGTPDTLSCNDFQEVLGGTQEVGVSRFAQVTGISEVEASQIFRGADEDFTASKPVQVELLCTRIDVDEDSRLSIADLAKGIFHGKVEKAERFMKRVSRLLHVEPEEFGAEDATAPFQDFQFWLLHAIRSVGGCAEDADDEACDHVLAHSLSAASKPHKLHPLISLKFAQALINKIRCGLVAHGWMLTFRIEQRGLTTREFFSFLVCPTCNQDEPLEQVQLEVDHLLFLTHDDREKAVQLMSLIRRHRRGISGSRLESAEDESIIDQHARDKYKTMFQEWRMSQQAAASAEHRVAYLANPLETEPDC